MEREPRSPSWFRLHIDRSAVLTDDVEADGQAEARALGFGRVERVEDGIELVGRNARALPLDHVGDLRMEESRVNR